MAGFSVEIIVDKDSVKHVFATLEKNVQQTAISAWLLAIVDPFLRERVRNRFSNEGDDAVGGAWAALRPSTEGIRASQGYSPSHPINVRSGAMENFLIGTPGK